MSITETEMINVGNKQRKEGNKDGNQRAKEKIYKCNVNQMGIKINIKEEY